MQRKSKPLWWYYYHFTTQHSQAKQRECKRWMIWWCVVKVWHVFCVHKIFAQILWCTLHTVWHRNPIHSVRQQKSRLENEIIKIMLIMWTNANVNAKHRKSHNQHQHGFRAISILCIYQIVVGDSRRCYVECWSALGCYCCSLRSSHSIWLIPWKILCKFDTLPTHDDEHACDGNKELNMDFNLHHIL